MKYVIKVRCLKKFYFGGWMVDSYYIHKHVAEHCLKLLKMQYCDGVNYEAKIFEID